MTPGATVCQFTHLRPEVLHVLLRRAMRERNVSYSDGIAIRRRSSVTQRDDTPTIDAISGQL